MIHLTFEGFNVGQTYCGTSRTVEGEYHHANVTALAKPEYRAKVCSHCLTEYDLTESTDIDDFWNFGE